MHPDVEKEIIQKTIDGDLRAFNLLIDAYKRPVYYLCFKILQVKEEAEEVAQDVFVKLFRQLKKFRGEAKFSTWVFRIAYNECISKIRKNRKYLEQENIEDFDISFIEKNYENIEQQERSALLQIALDKLDAESKAIVLMHYYREKPLEEIAEITGLSRENVKIKLFRARKRLLYIIEKKFKLDKTEWV